MIVGTAGHIDHGKTALIKALTGTDADRLKAEKERGITLDLGFAYQHFEDGTAISFLDVPGHEKLVRTMVAGATGIDYVLLVVAADDGPMPQTREHLSILNLIGIKRGCIVITKIDRVSQDRVTEVTAELRMLLQNTPLESASVYPCSATRGVGIEVLAERLRTEAIDHQARSTQGQFRLAIDRAFTLVGTGLVVTGTVHSGQVEVGDVLTFSPKGIEVRVRGLRCENQESNKASIGQRCALNITSRRLEKDDIERGDWIVAPSAHAPSNRLDGQLTLLNSEQRDLAHWSPVHLHIGASDVTARLSLLDCKRISPGGRALCQLVLDAPVGAVHGDRFIVRDQAATRTLGGGKIIDPFPPARRTRTPERLAILEAATTDDCGNALRALSKLSSGGVDVEQFRLARNLSETELKGILENQEIVTTTLGAKIIAIHSDRWAALRDKILDTVSEYQRNHVDAAGVNAIELLRTFPDPKSRMLARQRLSDLTDEGLIVSFGQLVHLPGHTITLTSEDEVLWQDVERILGEAGVDQPRVTKLAEQLGLRPDELLPSLEKFARAGRLNRVSKAYFLLQDTIDDFISTAERCLKSHEDGLLTVGNFRETTGVTRHLVMPLLEYFDKVGFTRRYRIGRQKRREWSGDG